MKQIKVIDAMMGAGKSTGIQAYMMKHKDDKKFIYVSPLLSELERFIEDCRS